MLSFLQGKRKMFKYCGGEVKPVRNKHYYGRRADNTIKTVFIVDVAQVRKDFEFPKDLNNKLDQDIAQI